MAVAIELAPLIESARELYATPRGKERFDAYIELGTKHTREMQLPVSVMNPMGKEHVLAYVESLIELGAERVAAETAAEATSLLAGVDDTLRLAVVVADDLKGGWTNRAFTEFAHRYERQYEVERGWCVTLLWTSEEPSAEIVRARTLESIYRTVDERKAGAVSTLAQIMDREGRTMRFAGRTASRYDNATLAEIRARIEPHLGSDLPPAVFAALYGDDVAESLGYAPLRIPPNGGYELALHETQKRETV